MLRKVKPFEIFAPFTRVLEEGDGRIAEGYAFVNEVVPGEGGVRIKRSAMEAATEDYMKWGAIREMHQPSAVGTAISAEWDETGLKIRAKIVDDSAWNKVQERVYKGFSIGVAPLIMRGNDVEKLTHIENSLVDRPKDADALITAYRVATPAAEYECEEMVIVRTFADMIDDLKADDLRSDMSAAYWTFLDCLWGCDDATTIHQNIDEFTAYLHTLVGENDTETRAMIGGAIERMKPLRDPATIARIEGVSALEAEKAQLLTRVQTAESDAVKLRSELVSAQTRVQTLEKTPVTLNAPVRFPIVALERFAEDKPARTVADVDADLAEIRRAEHATPAEQNAAIQRVQRLKHERAALSA